MRKLLNKLKWQTISLDEGGVNPIVEDLEKERENINISDIWWMIPTLELDEESEVKSDEETVEESDEETEVKTDTKAQSKADKKTEVKVSTDSPDTLHILRSTIEVQRHQTGRQGCPCRGIYKINNMMWFGYILR